MSNVDKVSVLGQIYHILSPSIVGDYIETIGEGCSNPDGYEQDDVFLGYVDEVQYLFKASTAISYGETITENINCTRRILADICGDGSTPDISMTASVDSTTGTPTVTVTESGTVYYPNFDLAFTGLKGETGDAGATGATGATGETGNGISSIDLTSGAHIEGTLDTYTISYTDGTTSTFQVYNGADGDGAGDMTVAAYDSDLSVANAGGISSYVSSQIESLDVSDSAVSGSYVTAVSETDGEIAVTREAADVTPTEDSTALVTSGGVYTENEAMRGIVSDAYNSSTTYAAGDYFIYDNTLYHVDVACTGITPPNANYYTATTVASEISDLNALSDVEMFIVAFDSISVSAYTIDRVALDFSSDPTVTSYINNGYTIWIIDIYCTSTGIFCERSGYILRAGSLTVYLKYNNTISSTSTNVRAVMMAIK